MGDLHGPARTRAGIKGCKEPKERKGRTGGLSVHQARKLQRAHPEAVKTAMDIDRSDREANIEDRLFAIHSRIDAAVARFDEAYIERKESPISQSPRQSRLSYSDLSQSPYYKPAGPLPPYVSPRPRRRTSRLASRLVPLKRTPLVRTDSVVQPSAAMEVLSSVKTWMDSRIEDPDIASHTSGSNCSEGSLSGEEGGSVSTGGTSDIDSRRRKGKGGDLDDAVEVEKLLLKKETEFGAQRTKLRDCHNKIAQVMQAQMVKINEDGLRLRRNEGEIRDLKAQMELLEEQKEKITHIVPKSKMNKFLRKNKAMRHRAKAAEKSLQRLDRETEALRQHISHLEEQNTIELQNYVINIQGMEHHLNSVTAAAEGKLQRVKEEAKSTLGRAVAELEEKNKIKLNEADTAMTKEAGRLRRVGEDAKRMLRENLLKEREDALQRMKAQVHDEVREMTARHEREKKELQEKLASAASEWDLAKSQLITLQDKLRDAEKENLTLSMTSRKYELQALCAETALKGNLEEGNGCGASNESVKVTANMLARIEALEKENAALQSDLKATVERGKLDLRDLQQQRDAIEVRREKLETRNAELEAEKVHVMQMRKEDKAVALREREDLLRQVEDATSKKRALASLKQREANIVEETKALVERERKAKILEAELHRELEKLRRERVAYQRTHEAHEKEVKVLTDNLAEAKARACHLQTRVDELCVLPVDYTPSGSLAEGQTTLIGEAKISKTGRVPSAEPLTQQCPIKTAQISENPVESGTEPDNLIPAEAGSDVGTSGSDSDCVKTRGKSMKKKRKMKFVKETKRAAIARDRFTMRGHAGNDERKNSARPRPPERSSRDSASFYKRALEDSPEKLDRTFKAEKAPLGRVLADMGVQTPIHWGQGQAELPSISETYSATEEPRGVEGMPRKHVSELAASPNTPSTPILKRSSLPESPVSPMAVSSAKKRGPLQRSTSRTNILAHSPYAVDASMSPRNSIRRLTKKTSNLSSPRPSSISTRTPSITLRSRATSPPVSVYSLHGNLLAQLELLLRPVLDLSSVRCSTTGSSRPEAVPSRRGSKCSAFGDVVPYPSDDTVGTLSNADVAATVSNQVQNDAMKMESKGDQTLRHFIHTTSTLDTCEHDSRQRLSEALLGVMFKIFQIRSQMKYLHDNCGSLDTESLQERMQALRSACQFWESRRVDLANEQAKQIEGALLERWGLSSSCAAKHSYLDHGKGAISGDTVVHSTQKNLPSFVGDKRATMSDDCDLTSTKIPDPRDEARRKKKQQDAPLAAHTARQKHPGVLGTLGAYNTPNRPPPLPLQRQSKGVVIDSSRAEVGRGRRTVQGSRDQQSGRDVKGKRSNGIMSARQNGRIGLFV